MSWGEWLLQLVTTGLLLAAMPFVLRLHRQLAALRREGPGLGEGAQGLADATRQAEAASMKLRASAELVGRQVNDRLGAAETMRDDLRYLLERAETLADRLESQLRQGRVQEPAPPPAPAAKESAPGAQSQAERDLMRALVRGAAKEAAR